jgi:hypothetical protein
MPKDWTTRQMSDAHEAFIEERTGAKVTRGSGNQFNAQTDNRHSFDEVFATAYEAKSTFRDSLGITRKMLAKLCEQAGGLIPALPVRFYKDAYLREHEDWILVPFEHYMELREEAVSSQLCKESEAGLP